MKKNLFFTCVLIFSAVLFMSCASKPKDEVDDPSAPVYSTWKTDIVKDSEVSETVGDIRLSKGKWQRVQTAKLKFVDDDDEYVEEIYIIYNVDGNKAECVERVNLNKFTYSEEKIAELKEMPKEEILESKAALNATDLYFKGKTIVLYSVADDYALRMNRASIPIIIGGKNPSIKTNSSRTKYKATWTSKYSGEKYTVYFKKQ